jgi:hypothetical protein
MTPTGGGCHALHETIPGPAGEARDWDRFGTLFFPGARLIRASIAPDGIPQAPAMDLRAYPDDATGYFRLHSFHEVEMARRIESSGTIAHVHSTYEARHPQHTSWWRLRRAVGHDSRSRERIGAPTTR